MFTKVVLRRAKVNGEFLCDAELCVIEEELLVRLCVSSNTTDKAILLYQDLDVAGACGEMIGTAASSWRRIPACVDNPGLRDAADQPKSFSVGSVVLAYQEMYDIAFQSTRTYERDYFVRRRHTRRHVPDDIVD